MATRAPRATRATQARHWLSGDSAATLHGLWSRHARRLTLKTAQINRGTARGLAPRPCVVFGCCPHLGLAGVQKTRSHAREVYRGGSASETKRWARKSSQVISAYCNSGRSMALLSRLWLLALWSTYHLHVRVPALSHPASDRSTLPRWWGDLAGRPRRLIFMAEPLNLAGFPASI